MFGFALNWLIEERKQQHELRRSAGPVRIEAYQSLWPPCGEPIDHRQRRQQAVRLTSWYEKGGGLFLSLAAAEHYFAARKLWLREQLSSEDVAAVSHHLTWLPTEMKRHVGSYGRVEARTQIRSV